MTSPRRAQRPEVLFVCVHNAGRSQMAAALLQHYAGQSVDAVRAIRGRIDALVRQLVTELVPEPA